MRNSTSTPPRLVSASSSSNGRKHKRLFDIFTASATTEVLAAALPLSQQSTSTTMDTISLSSEKNISHSPYKKLRKDIFSSPMTMSKLLPQIDKSKIFIDTVHKHIKLDPLLIKIIDTVEFQRLHSLKQLGTCDFVFRGATHTRFEHSLGVAHLAGRLANVLRMNQPHLELTDADILCVKVAGLCHDLGHGPFSHVFDGVFLRRMYPSHDDDHHGGWRHEDGSVQMLRYILKENNISINEYGLNDTDLLFIEEIISGTKEADRRGRGPNKFFLYDIVNNSRSGLDVDKLDYFQRDAKMACVAGNPPDFERFIELARVLPAEPIDSHFHLEKYPLMICYPEKMIREAVALFATRFHMHQQVYTHQAVKQVEFMITDALELANPYIYIEGNKTDRFPEGLYRISEVIYEMKALSNLNDSVLELILASREEGLRPAKDLLLRIKRRQLYKCVGKTAYSRDNPLHFLTEEEILQEIINQHQQIIHESNGTFQTFPFSSNLLESFEEEKETDLLDNCTILNPDDAVPPSAQYYQNHISPSKQSTLHSDFIQLTPQDLIVEKMHIHYGMKSHNPVANLRFFPKNAVLAPENGNLTLAKQVDERVYETLLPRSFEDRSIRLFCRTIDKEQAAIHAFERWCTSRDSHLPFPSLSQQE